MRRVLHIMAAFLLLAVPSGSFAQNEGAPFRKPEFEVAVDDSIARFELSDKYSVRKGTYSSLYEFSKYDALKPKKLEIDKIPSFYARIGAQVPLMPLADLDYRKMVSGNIVFGFKGHHDSYWQQVQSRMDNSAGGSLKVVWPSGDFNFGVDYDNRRFRFTDMSDNSATHSLGHVNVSAAISSANEKVNDIYYDFKCTFDNLNSSLTAFYEPSAPRLVENKFAFSGYVGTTFDVHRIYVDMDIKAAGYDAYKEYMVAMVQFSPLYEFKSGRFSGKFGVIFGNRFGTQDGATVKASDGNDLAAVSSIFPNIDARVEIARNILWAHVKVDGGYDLNAFSDISSVCPVVNPATPLMVGRHPVDAGLYLESVLSGRLALNLSAGYRVDENKPYMAPVIASSSVNGIAACRMDVNTFRLGAELLWKSSSITTGGEFHYNIYSSKDFENVTQLPAITSRVFFRYNWRQRFVLSLECNYASAISGAEFGAWTVPDKIDLSLEADFALSRHLRVFVKGGNLLDRSIQLMPTYDEPGINFGGGLAVTL